MKKLKEYLINIVIIAVTAATIGALIALDKCRFVISL